MKPIEMQKGIKRTEPCGLRVKRLRKFEMDRIDRSPRRKNWHRHIGKALPKLMNVPFFRSLMSWRFGTSKEFWNDPLRPNFLIRQAGGSHENRDRS